MLPSPLQLIDAVFLNFDVKPRIDPNIFGGREIFEPFSFNRTNILTQIDQSLAEDKTDENFTVLLVKLTIELKDEGENPPPYVCNVSCVGYFAISKLAFPDETRRIDTGVVNGASILYGMIREKIADFTARSWYGMMTLPTGNFSDMAPSSFNKGETATPKEMNTESKPRKTKKSIQKP